MLRCPTCGFPMQQERSSPYCCTHPHGGHYSVPDTLFGGLRAIPKPKPWQSESGTPIAQYEKIEQTFTDEEIKNQYNTTVEIKDNLDEEASTEEFTEDFEKPIQQKGRRK